MDHQVKNPATRTLCCPFVLCYKFVSAALIGRKKMSARHRERRDTRRRTDSNKKRNTRGAAHRLSLSGPLQDRQVSKGQTQKPPLPRDLRETLVCLRSKALQASLSDGHYTPPVAHALQAGLGVWTMRKDLVGILLKYWFVSLVCAFQGPPPARARSCM